MFFNANTPLEEIKSWIDKQLPATHMASKNGIDISIAPHKSLRSLDQNRFLMVVLTAITRFYHETGYICPDLKAWEMRPTILKEYFKDRYGIEHTRTLDTAEFTKFIDFIQMTMVEETGGNWEILTTDSAWLKTLLKDE